MAEIRLLIPDENLRAALQEQPALAALGSITEAASAEAAFAGDAVLIADEGACDKKFWKLLGAANAGAKKKRVFILGSYPEGEKGGEKNGEGEGAEIFPKPFRLGHLIARLQFYLNASVRRKSADADFGAYRFEAHNRQLVAKESGEAVRLTEKETALLDYLAQSEQPVSREELLASIWGYDARIDTHTLETHIYRLRRKLGANGGTEGGPNGGADFLINTEGGYALRREPA